MPSALRCRGRRGVLRPHDGASIACMQLTASRLAPIDALGNRPGAARGGRSPLHCQCQRHADRRTSEDGRDRLDAPSQSGGLGWRVAGYRAPRWPLAACTWGSAMARRPPSTRRLVRKSGNRWTWLRSEEALGEPPKYLDVDTTPVAILDGGGETPWFLGSYAGGVYALDADLGIASLVESRCRGSERPRPLSATGLSSRWHRAAGAFPHHRLDGHDGPLGARPGNGKGGLAT